LAGRGSYLFASSLGVCVCTPCAKRVISVKINPLDDTIHHRPADWRICALDHLKTAPVCLLGWMLKPK
jgi:hypothetical protein